MFLPLPYCRDVVPQLDFAIELHLLRRLLHVLGGLERALAYTFEHDMGELIEGQPLPFLALLRLRVRRVTVCTQLLLDVQIGREGGWFGVNVYSGSRR